MLKNYLKIAWRNLIRHKGYTFINVTGLAVGLAVCLLIALWVQDELSYDRFHKKAERIYRVNLEPVPGIGQDRPVAFTPNIVAPLLRREFAEVEKAVRMYRDGGFVHYRDRVFQGVNYFYADSTFFDIFTFTSIAGDPKNALKQPNTAVLTEEAARRYFGEENSLGKTIVLNNNEELEVTGVVEDVPANSHFRFDFIVSWASLGDWAQDETWSNANYYTYLLLGEYADAAIFEKKIDQMVAEREAAGDYVRALSLMPLTRIHLYADLEYALDPTGDIRYVYIFTAIAVLILLIAGINYMNLSTARSMQRAKEVGIRKTAGAHRGQLGRQFLTESVLVSLGAALLALQLAQWALPAMNSISGKALSLQPVLNGPLLLVIVGTALVAGLFAGSYPAFVLSGFQPVKVLKATLQSQSGGQSRHGGVRNMLVVFQFAVSIILISGTFVVRGQLDYLQSTNLGFDKEHVVVLHLISETRERYRALEQAFLQHSGVQSISAVNQYPTALGWTGRGHAEGLPDESGVAVKGFLTDGNAVETLGLNLVAGRDFFQTPMHPDSTEEGYRYLLNETAVRSFGWTPEEAPGKRFRMGGRAGRVIGVIEDFNYASLHNAVEPLAMWYAPGWERHLIVRLAPGSEKDALAFMQERWIELAPNVPFNYSFLDDRFDRLYRNEQQVSSVFSAFSLLAILIACLGLLGLAAFTAERRTKEIGVRKVLGATIGNIIGLLSRDFLKLVLAGFVIAVPISWYAMNRWLQDFAYRIEIGPGIFAIAGGAAILIALATVSWQSVRAALANPVESLKSE